MRLTRALSRGIAVSVFAMLGAASAAAQVYWVQSANYGWNNKRMDVTARVRRLVNGPNFKVNNNNMGVDPAVGKDKTLRIVGQAQNGTIRTFTFGEGQTVNSQMFAGTGGGNWAGGGPGWGGNALRIVQANYVPINGGRGSNVTMRLRSMIGNNRLNFIANNENLGGDPAPGRPKKLVVTYDYRGQVNTVTVGENGRLNIP